MTVEMLVLFTALAGFLTAITVLVAVVLKELRDVRHQLNSRLDELLELTRQAARAEGVKEGRKRPSA